MQIAQEIKWKRLIIAVLAILLIADTVPHPNLSPGLLQNLATRLADQPSQVGTHYFSVR